ncbi:hypothetical protein ATY81_11340 [Rhizobium sp. R72]|uniref:hypothetical protein n=1 Tax=unclassified Rhizobium TaxID=2613769 RepID=UPI000B53150D|nr:MULTISPECIES: hypothetical protein [unclassified Rhizobium]OWV85044.1 hypothetical protein ATY79_10160 [Rhizobium sp. R693]OWV94892.1 hypothetical protein ATY81_11340 [Rhizobium sp. R72]OWV95132.1 hypothetical protein ATY80_11340 [Rhizobium sp. R711]
MITTLTILSFDQGRIYSPPPEPVPELTAVESEAEAAAVADTQDTRYHLRWLDVSTGLHALARLLTPTFGSTPFGKAH